MSSKVWGIGFSKHEKVIEYHVHIRSTDQFKQVGVREKKWQKWDQKFGILTLNLLSLKNKYEDQSKNLCLFKFGVLGYRNLKNFLLRIMFISDPQIILNRLGCMEKWQMKSIVWMTDAFGCAFALPSHRSVKFWNCLMDDFCLLN